MDSGSLFWLIVFALASLAFFGTAVVITIVGMRDLRDLLSGSKHKQ